MIEEGIDKCIDENNVLVHDSWAKCWVKKFNKRLSDRAVREVRARLEAKWSMGQAAVGSEYD